MKFKSLWWPFLFVALAGLSVWGLLAYRLLILQLPTLVLGVLAVGSMVRFWSQASPTSLPRNAWRNLSLFGVTVLSLTLISSSLWLTRQRALGIVKPGRSVARVLPESVGITEYATITFPASDGLKLQGWYAPTHNGAVIIFLHGHANNRTGLLDEAGLFARQGYGVLLYDARNHGWSEGTVTTLGLNEVRDVQGAVNFVLTQPGVDAARIGVVGHSMGGGTALLATAQIPEIDAVIAESAFTSLEDNIRNGVEKLAGLPAFPFAPLVIFWGQQETGVDIRQVRPIESIATLSPRPVLLVHGEQDDTLPVQNSRDLYAAAHDPKALYLIPGAHHADLFEVGGEGYAQRIVAFMQTALLAQ